jgi:hypothetical protein
MDWTSFWIQGLSTALLMATTAGIYTILKRDAQITDLPVNANRRELRLNRIYIWMGIISTIIGFGPLFILPFIEWDNGFFWSVPLIFLMFGPVGVYLVAAYFNHRIGLAEDGFILTNWRNKTKNYPWTDVEDIEFKPQSGYYKLIIKGKKVRVSEGFTGMNVFLNLIHQRTGLDTRFMRRR